MSVFDTSAVLAIIYNEEGRHTAAARLPGSTISTVNLAELARDMIVTGSGGGSDAVRWLERLGLTLSSPTSSDACRAAELKRVRGLSLGDCFCIALGEARNEPLVTGDQLWARVPEIRVPVELIR